MVSIYYQPTNVQVVMWFYRNHGYIQAWLGVSTSAASYAQTKAFWCIKEGMDNKEKKTEK